MKALKVFLVVNFFVFYAAASDDSFVDVEVLSQVPEKPNAELKHNVILDGYMATSASGLDAFTVFLEIFKPGGQPIGNCTGVIIAQDMILTSGHCLKEEGRQVSVKFGLGGERGFTHQVWADSYLSVYKAANKNQASGASLWENDFLSFNEQQEVDYRRKVSVIQSWIIEKNPLIKDRFADFAVVKIPQIPKGYNPISFFSGRVEFGQTVFVAGFGTNSRVKKDNVRAMRFSPQKLVGRYEATFINTVASTDTHKDSQTHVIGFQVYSPEKKSICFGDSGGPTVVVVNNEYQLLGLNTFVYNNCAGATWTVSIGHIYEQVLQMVWQLRRQTEV